MTTKMTKKFKCDRNWSDRMRRKIRLDFFFSYKES